MRYPGLIIGSILFCSGLSAQNVVTAPMEDVNKVVDNTLDSLNLARTARPVSGSTRRGSNPVLFLVGNSTMRTGTLGNGSNGQWGWGYHLPEYFDPEKITVENHALGGMSSRTFYNRLWKEVLDGIKPGDWVIIELGHNDNGPYDSGRARASIPGIGNDSIPVIIKETGVKEVVYSYGEYMRRFINDVRKKGAHPILFSLTPRCAWVDEDSTVIARVDKTFGLWAKQVADSMHVPFVDLNDITAQKYEKFGKDKVKTMFYLDRIHTSDFGARVNAESAVEGLRMLSDVPLKDYILPMPVDSITGATRKNGCPMLFTIGDSTVKNEDSDDGSMWGWGSVIAELFDTTRISIENHAMAGRSARTFLDEGRWDKIYNALQPGDYVLIQFGHNDAGDINTGKARGELPGNGSESKVFRMEKTGKNQVVYSYGWYLRKFIMDAKEKGAIPVILSHTPRNRWKDGVIENNKTNFGQWAREAAIQGGAYFIDLNAISGAKLQALGEGHTATYFKNDHTHTSKKGARLNAASIAEGLRETDCELKKYLKPWHFSFNMQKMDKYDAMRGFGYDLNTFPVKDGSQPFFFSIRVPDGNYKVTLKLGSQGRPAVTTVRAESRRLMLNQVSTKKGEAVERSFMVHKRNPAINLHDTVRINPREVNTPTWDDKLTLEFTGESPAIQEIKIEPVSDEDEIRTVFLCGNSTVVDQTYEPWTSWGQIIPSIFNDRIVVANHAESGERASSFLASKRLDKVLSMAQPGDWIMIEFGHNDQKEKGYGTGAWYNFSTTLKTFIDRAKEKGLKPILITPTARRFFDGNGKILNTHGDYPDAMRELAARENIPLIDLNKMTMRLYESLGVEGSKKAFVHYPAGRFPGQEKPLADNTHFSPYGATQIAKCVANGIRHAVPDLVEFLLPGKMYDETSPDNPEDFVWPEAPIFEYDKPYGN